MFLRMENTSYIHIHNTQAAPMVGDIYPYSILVEVCQYLAQNLTAKAV